MVRSPSFTIIDYGVGNLMSVSKALKSVGALPTITKDLREALEAEAIVLPGVGAYQPAMKKLRSHIASLKQASRNGTSLFGICLGMELFFSESTEGGLVDGLGFIPGRVIRLPSSVKIPHMGWNTVSINREHPLISGIRSGDYFYFVHSYYASPDTSDAVLASARYGDSFPAIVGKNTILGTQFHPEKSGRVGLRVLKNLVGLVRRGSMN
ncbi:MAG: imidazole glycerol phosphate synthase subunit HisH [Candidatus Bathyarchaeia archaeon]